MWYWYVLGIGGGLLLLAALLLATAYVCFWLTFYSKPRKPLGEEEFELPPGKVYEEYRDVMIAWTREMRQTPYEEVSIVSFDGLTLRGRYYEYAKGAPLEILFHGYRGHIERDLCGGMQRCFALGRNALIVDQRASGRSDGSVISFGINERKDCLRWIQFAIEKFGDDIKIMLGGVSMGAATVLMAASEPNLPKNVVCVLGDCGYSSAKEIIKVVTKREFHLSAGFFYPFIKAGARIFGKFDLEETSPEEAVKNCKIPVLLIHGDTDAFVPYEMCGKIYEACGAPQKRFVTIEGAGHGLAYPKDQEGYIAAIRAFQTDCGF